MTPQRTRGRDTTRRRSSRRRRMTTHDRQGRARKEEWLAARLELLEAEKDLTRRGDEVARRRQDCPGSASTRSIDSRPTRGAPRWRTSSAALAAARLPLHVRARLPGGLPVLLGDRRRVRRVRGGPREPRRHVDGGFAGAAREAPGVQRRMGWTFPWSSSFGGDFNGDYSARSPRRSSARARPTTSGAGGRRRSRGKAASRTRRAIAAMSGTDPPPTGASGRA